MLGPPSAESSFARLGCYLWRRDVLHLVGRHYPSFFAHTSSCARPNPSHCLCLPPAVGLGRLLPVPAGRWPFPTLSLRSLCGRSDPYPAVSPSCSCPFLARGRRPPRLGNALGTPETPCHATSTGNLISGLQSFVYLRAPTIARPPDCTHLSRSIMLGGQAVYTTHIPVGYLRRVVASLRVRHGQLTRLDSHQLDRSLVGCSSRVRF